MRDTFGTGRKGDQDTRRDRLQSQGVPVSRTIEATGGKPNPRKVIEDELNQTMPVSIKNAKAKANDLVLAPPRTRDGRSEVPKDRKAFATIDPENSYRQEKPNKIEMIK